MPIDAHAHYVPPAMIEALETEGGRFGVTVHRGPDCKCAFHFGGGPKLRPFFTELVEPVDARLATMESMGVTRQVLSSWADLFAPHLDEADADDWHSTLNAFLARVRDANPDRFSFLASLPLPYGQAAARRLDREVRERGAVGAVIPANVLDQNLGDLDLDPLWRAAVELDVGVFIHPVQATSQPRSARYGLTQIAQYTSDTTMTAGSLMMSGVLDRFPTLRLLLAHGGGGVPYLIGRFDCMRARMDREAQGDVSKQKPSDYLRCFYYDTILHDPDILRWLGSRVGVDRLVLGTDYSFPPADRDPLASIMAAGFTPPERDAITESNVLRLFPALAA